MSLRTLRVQPRTSAASRSCGHWIAFGRQSGKVVNSFIEQIGELFTAVRASVLIVSLRHHDPANVLNQFIAFILFEDLLGVLLEHSVGYKVNEMVFSKSLLIFDSSDTEEI